MCGAALCAAWLAPMGAQAQTDAIDNVVPATSTTLGLAASVAVVPFVVTTTVVGESAPEERIEAYLEERRFELAADVSVGAGSSLDELASLLGVRDVARLGRGMRARGARWRALLGARAFDVERVRAELEFELVRVDEKG